MTDYVSTWSSRPLSNIALLEVQENALFGYTPEGDFTSMATQSGSPIDTPKVVSYGSNKQSNSGILDYNNGVFTFLKSGTVGIKSRLRTGRTGASGVSHLFFWVESSINGGSTWNKIGNSINIHLNNSNETQTFFDIAFLVGVAGLKLRTLFARSSTGSDSGDLIAESPSAALIALGVMGAPSAQITVYKDSNQLYV